MQSISTYLEIPPFCIKTLPY